MHVHLLAFAGVAALITITPGADMAVVTRIALAHGRRSAWLASIGIVNGLLCWALASGLGLAALLSASATAYAVLKLLGACYLIWLGLQTIISTRRRVNEQHETDATAVVRVPALSAWASYRQGLCSNLFNPKIAVFYTSFLPQFIEPGSTVLVAYLLLAGIHMLLGLLWLFSYALLVARGGEVLRRPSVKAAIERVTGVVLIAFGLRLGLER